MYLIDKDTGKIQGAQTHSNIYQEIEINESITSAVRRCPKKSLIGIHNHPESSTPSGGDYESFYVRGYSQAFIVCHNGDLYEYHAGKKKFTGTRVDLEIAKWKKRLYTQDEAYEKALNQLKKDYGIWWRKI